MSQAKLSLDLSWLKQKPVEVTIGTDIDYFRLFYALKSRHQSCYLFESLEISRHQDRYFTVGFDPCLTFRASEDNLTLSGSEDAIFRTTGTKHQTHVSLQGINPYNYLKEQIPLTFLSKTHQGGLIGYFSYESVNYFEPAVRLSEHPDYAAFHLGLYADGLIFDTETHLLTYYTFDEDRSVYIRRLIRELDEIKVPTSLRNTAFMGHSETKESYTKAVLNTLEEVRIGNTFQSEVGFKTFYEIDGDKIAIYDKLRRLNPSPYMYYVKFDEVELFGSSPEILVSSTNRRVLTAPAAGTRPRGKDPKEDKEYARDLLADPKEIAEHHMLIDLHRNDLSRVCEVGSVRIAHMMYLIRFSHVQHIVSDIIGELSADKTVYDLLAAILPGGVVSGAPKIETMKIIDRNEQTPRGPYGGAVGRFSLNGDATFCLPIRSLFCKGNQCFAQTSSGVVHDSKVETEYEEVRAKSAAMEQTIHELAQGVETDEAG